MAQIKTGTVQVQDGSAVVTEVSPVQVGQPGWNTIQTGAIFAVPGRDQTYLVNAVDYTSNPKTLTLASPYIGLSNGAVETVQYCVTKDFTPNFRLPLMARNDLETASIFSRSMQAIDAAIGLRLITSVAESASINAGSSLVTVTLPNHNLITNQVVTVSGSVDGATPPASSAINGTHIVTVTGRDTFTYAVTAIQAASCTAPAVSYRSAVSLGESHTLPGHNFKVGTALRYDSLSGFAPASSRGGESNGLIIGIVSSVSGSSFTICSSGPIYNLQGLPTNLAKGTVMYLGPDSTPVNLTATQPTMGAVLHTISSLTRVSSVATAVSAAHGFIDGHQIILQGAVQSEYNGIHYITVLDSDTFTFSVVGSPATPATGTVQASDPLGQLRIPVLVVCSDSAIEGQVFGQLINFPTGQVPLMAGSSETVAGAAGAVPAPPASAVRKFFSNRGLWETPEAQAASVKFETLVQTPSFTLANWSDTNGAPSSNASVYGALLNLNSRLVALNEGNLSFLARASYIASGSWVCPSGVTKARVIVVGGGAGGLGSPSYDTPGGGGGSGGFSVSVVSVTPGVTYSFTVGAGGAAGLSGTSSSFGSSSIIAYGGLAPTSIAGGAGAPLGVGTLTRLGTPGLSGVGAFLGGAGAPSPYEGLGGAGGVESVSYPKNGVGFGSGGGGSSRNLSNAGAGAGGAVIICY